MIDVVVPQVGEAATEVTLVRWFKGVGDVVEKGEPLFEVDTEKYVVEIEAFASGTLAEILVSAGTEVMPLQVVARLLPEGVTAERSPDPSTASAPAILPTPPLSTAPETPEPSRRGPRVLASPKARRLAAELGLDLTAAGLKGTGSGGLITAEDVQAAAGAEAVGASDIAPEPLTGLRRTIALRMQASKHEVPHFYLLADVDMAEAQRLRAHCTEDLGWERKPTMTDLMIAACARTLQALPDANVSLIGDGLVRHPHVNIGIAVSLADGLVVPVLGDASRLGLRDLSDQASLLVERARAGRLRESDLRERSIVVSNLGMYEVDAFLAIIDMPDSMILAVGRVADRCVPVDGVPAVRPVCTLALSVDHRAFDGVLGARFLAGVKGRLEHPFELLDTQKEV